MPEAAMPARGRPRRYAEYERFVRDLPETTGKRPRYLHGIGVFRGARGDTAWIKLRLPHGATYDGRHYPPKSAVEVKLGNLASWGWAELEAKRDELQGKADRDQPLQEAVVPAFDEFADDWLERAKARVKDYASIRAHVNNHLKPFFSNMPLDALTSTKVNQWLAQQLGTDLKPGTVKRQFNTLRAILNDAIRSGHLERNLCAHTEPIRGVGRRQRFLDSAELIRLLKAADETADWLSDFVLWCIHSGMRKGEIRALEWSDIREVQKKRLIVQVRTSKVDEPRFVNCTDTMEEILKRQQKRKLKNDERIFPVSKMTLRRKWEKARKTGKLEDVTLHDLRRTHATHAAAAGIDLRTLAERIGHTDLSMLQKHYAAVMDSKSVEAANVIGSEFDRLTNKES